MKKSSFLHKPKDLLSKSFNPAKCKTALKLASSRIKLLKNKKENQVKQMKRELAQFLESGQDQTARIRVEHVVREEKMMAAYELLEIYCELIVARLPIIETQKNCPIDLKEAITSVIFASPRCGDIPELLDVRKQFTGKYGKEFIAAAIDLRPDCGVSRMLIEKLSARAPDGQTKIKVLTAIAEEHNIKWDPKSFGENEALPPNDLLNGPATFEKANRPHPEEPRFHTPDVQAPSPTMRNQSSNFSENNLKSQRNETPDSGLNNGNRNSASSGARPDTVETRQSNHQEGSAYSGRQNWNMNFKDAASAAQAAAESAEHASMAARAAAELSSLGNTGKQYYPESEDLSGHSPRGEGTGKHSISRVGEYHAPKDSANSSLTDHHPMVENERRGRQYSVESQKLHGYAHAGEETRIPRSKFSDDHPPRDSATSSVAEPPPELQDMQRKNVGSANMHRVAEKSHGHSVGIEKRYPLSSSKFSDDHPPRDSVTSSFAEPPPEYQDMQRKNVGSDNMHGVSDKSYRDSVSIEKRYPQSSSKFSDDHPQRDSATSSFAEPPPEFQDMPRENVGSDNMHRVSEESYGYRVGIQKRYPQSPSLTSKVLTSKVSFDSDPPVSGLREAERYSENSLFNGEDLGPELTLKKETYKDEPERRVDFRKEGFNHYDHDIFEEDKSTKQSSNIHFSPHSVSGFDDNYVNSGPEKHGSDSSDRHSVNISEDLFDKMAQSSSHDGGVVTFDDYGSDEDFGLSNSSHPNFNEESTLFRPPGRTSPSRSSADSLGVQSSQLHKGSESLFPTKQNLFTEFSESSEVPVDSPEQDKSGPVMFDDSDGPNSDDESDMNQPLVHNRKDSTDVHSEQYQTLSSASSSFHDSHWKNNQRNETVQSQEDFGVSKAPADEMDKLVSSQSSFVVVNDAKHGKTSSSSSMRQMDDEDSRPGAELNFGKLTGGLRHKGRTRFPYQSHQVVEFSASSTKVAEPDPKMENFTNARKSEIPENARPLRLPSSHLDPDSESSEEEYEIKPKSHRQEPYNVERKSNLKPNVRGPVRYFNSESSGSEDDSTKQVLTGRSPLGSGVSRRTKGTPADSASTGSGDSRRSKATPAYSGSFFPKVQATSYTSSNSGEGRPSAASFSGSETPQPSKSHVRLSGDFKDLEKPSSERKAYKPNLESNISANIENKKSSSVAQTSIAEQKVEPSVTKKPSSSNHVTREDSDKKASHVHPKLPDYDTIAARLQAIRSNRQ